MISKKHWSNRPSEAITLLMVFIILTFGFALVSAARSVQQNEEILFNTFETLLPPVVVGLAFIGLHLLLLWRKVDVEQVLLPTVGLIFSIGLIMIWRLRGTDGVWQQLSRGFIPGVIVIGAFILRPDLIERIRRAAIPISLVGLGLTLLTAVFGVVDETGARLALRLGPLPPIQTSEILKVSLIIFLAWYIDREGAAAEGRANILFGWLRLPPLRYFIPGAIFVAVATLALVRMSDFGAVLIMGCLFLAMLYAGFETRIFLTVSAIGLGFALLVGLVLATTWEIPSVIQHRFEAFLNPWSTAPLLVDGQPTGITISEGPGYQIQQAVYAIISGGITGTGLGFGKPQFVPLAHSDFIFSAILEEMGSAVGIALLALFAVLLVRLLRTAALLPRGQVFERLLLTGIAMHFFAQVLIMVGGTLNLLPLTGVTIPFLSQGGVALMINLIEVGTAFAILQRLEATPA